MPIEWITDRLAYVRLLLLALSAGVAGVAGSFAVAGFTPSFIAGPVAGTLARRMPGVVITFAIVVLGDLGSQLNVLAALVLSTLLLTGGAFLGLGLGARFGSRGLGCGIAAVAASTVTFAVTRAVVASVVAGGAVGLVLAVAAFLPSSAPVRTLSPDRRRVLGGVASAVAISLGGVALGTRETTSQTRSAIDLDVEESVLAQIRSSLTEADQKSLDIETLEPLVSSNFYQVDINATDPEVDADQWSLSITGAVEKERSFTYEDIRDMEPENRFVSLRCVGESLNGKKLDNALWTGVPIMDLLGPEGLPDECCVMLRAADGFFEEFPLAALEDGFLAYGMNGRELPRGHGYPVRALIPGHWGEINVKWLTEIEVLEEEQDGYWEKRGWHGTGPVNTVAKLHVANELEDGRRRVAGHAYAGTRGIQQVEVSTDGGDTWTEARLSEQLPGNDVWRQWSHAYEMPGEQHEVVVRATDGTGELQPREESDAFPSGASGWVSKTYNQ